MEQLLALGTVVKVRLSEKNTVRLVVAGYFPGDKSTEKIYDYSAVPYPWGMQPNPAIQMFNQSQIVSVEFPGYLDEDGERLTRELPQALEQYKKEVSGLLKQAYAKKNEKTEPAAKIQNELEEFG